MSKQRGYIIAILLLFLGFYSTMAQVKTAPYAADILKFRKLDSIHTPPQHAILFIGSSSFTLWKDVGKYFPGYSIINRAYGGSCITDQIRDIKDIVYPYNAKQVVIYCGENDFAYYDTLSPQTLTRRFIELYHLIRMKLPDAKITYVSMKPCPSRWNLANKFIIANHSIRDFLKHQPHTSYVDVWNKMLDVNHRPMGNIFLQDSLHMNAAGYSIWQKAIKPHLMK